MNKQFGGWLGAALCCLAGIAAAQQPPAGKSSAQSEAGEPRADTSAPQLDAAPSPAASTPAGSAPGPAAPAPAAPAPGAPVTAQHVKPVRAAAPAARPADPKSDRVDLNTATVTGDREQPKVMYIVPWKQSSIGDLSGKPMNSLVDEILAPIDRDEFKREVIYYQAVQAEASQNGARAEPSPQGEK